MTDTKAIGERIGALSDDDYDRLEEQIDRISEAEIATGMAHPEVDTVTVGQVVDTLSVRWCPDCQELALFREVFGQEDCNCIGCAIAAFWDFNDEGEEA